MTCKVTKLTNSGSKSTDSVAKSRGKVSGQVVQNGPLLRSCSKSGWAGWDQSDAPEVKTRLRFKLLRGNSTSSVRPRTSNHPLSPRSTLSIADHVGQIQPAIRAHCRRSSQHRSPPVHGTQDTHTPVYIYTRPTPPNRPLNHAQLTSLSSSALLLPPPVPSHPSGQPPPLPPLPPSSPPAPPHGTTTSSVVRPTP